MHRTHRSPLLLACALFAALLGVPATASAAIEPPTLSSPAASATGIVEGGSLDFEWRGSLQGDASEIARSFFRIEVAAAADVPAGTQAEWTTTETTMQTEPGDAATSVSMGVLPAGTWRWRVCAWGVLDGASSQSIQQLPGGCSASRSFETVAATANRGTIGEVTVDQKEIVEGETKKVIVEREAEAEPVVEQPVQEPETVEEVVEAVFSAVKPRAATTESGKAAPSSVSLGDEGLDLSASSSRDGVSGAVLGGLNGTLPLLPIPFWTLALLLACVPVARAWRRSVLGMFDQPEHTRVLDAVLEDAAAAPALRALKVEAIAADGDAVTPATTPERETSAA